MQARCGQKMSSGAVAIQKFFAGKGAEVGKRRAQAIVIPIPPGKPIHARAVLGGEALADQLGGYAADDRIGSDILGDNSTRADNRRTDGSSSASRMAGAVLPRSGSCSRTRRTCS